MCYKTTPTEHFLLNHTTEVNDMDPVESMGISIADHGFGAVTPGKKNMPMVVHLGVQEALAEAEIFIGHIEDRIRAGGSATFRPSTEVMLASALALISDEQTESVERDLLSLELSHQCNDAEGLLDAQAVAAAVFTLSGKIKEKLKEHDLFEHGKLMYTIGRHVNGQVELVRLTADDPNLGANSPMRFAARGFIVPSFVHSEA